MYRRGSCCACMCKPVQSTKRLILQAEPLLSDSCGGVQYVGCVLCMCVHEKNVSNSNPWLTVQSAPSSKAGGDSVCFEAASLTSHWHVKTVEIDFFHLLADLNQLNHICWSTSGLLRLEDTRHPEPTSRSHCFLPWLWGSRAEILPSRVLMITRDLWTEHKDFNTLSNKDLQTLIQQLYIRARLHYTFQPWAPMLTGLPCTRQKCVSASCFFTYKKMTSVFSLVFCLWWH